MEINNTIEGFGTENLLNLNAFQYVRKHINIYAKKYDGSTLLLSLYNSDYPTDDYKEAVKVMFDSYLSESKDLDEEEQKELLKKKLKKHYTDFKSETNDYIKGMIKIVDHLLCEYATKQEWTTNSIPDKQFTWSQEDTGSAKGTSCYYVFSENRWQQTLFKNIYHLYIDICNHYIQHLKITEGFEKQLEREFQAFYERRNPFKMSMDRPETLMVTKNGLCLKIDPQNRENLVEIKGKIKPSDFTIETLNINVDEENIKDAINQDPMHLFNEGFDIPHFRRILQLTLKEQDQIESVLTSLAYPLLNLANKSIHKKKIFYNYGRPHTGKSFIQSLTIELFPNSVVNLSNEQIFGTDSQFALHLIFTSRFIYINEAQDSRLPKKGIGMLNALGSRDHITADRKHQKHIEGNNYGVVHYWSNIPPPQTGSPAFQKRLHISRWTHDFDAKTEENKKNIELPEMIAKEGESIVLLLLSFVNKFLQTKEIPESKIHRDEMRELISSNDGIMGQWYETCKQTGMEQRIQPIQKLYDNYETFAKIQRNKHKGFWDLQAIKYYKSIGENIKGVVTLKHIQDAINITKTNALPIHELKTYLINKGHDNKQMNDDGVLFFDTYPTLELSSLFNDPEDPIPEPNTTQTETKDNSLGIEYNPDGDDELNSREW